MKIICSSLVDCLQSVFAVVYSQVRGYDVYVQQEDAA